jgi:hypothetical protein
MYVANGFLELYTWTYASSNVTSLKMKKTGKSLSRKI